MGLALSFMGRKRKEFNMLNLLVGLTLNTYLWHLRMRHIFVNNDSLDQHRIFHASSDLGFDLDEFEVDILTLNVGHGEDRVHGDLGHLPVALVDAR